MSRKQFTVRAFIEKIPAKTETRKLNPRRGMFVSTVIIGKKKSRAQTYTRMRRAAEEFNMRHLSHFLREAGADRRTAKEGPEFSMETTSFLDNDRETNTLGDSE